MHRGKEIILLLILAVGGCVHMGARVWDARLGPEDPTRFDGDAAQSSTPLMPVQTIVNQRCVVCHGCYDAPCQLKLTSYEGLVRGASKNAVYDAERLVAAAPTRLHVDAQKPSEWRENGFYPVLNERVNTANANVEGSVLAQLLLLKQAHPTEAGKRLPESFDLRLNREASCPKLEEIAEYKKDTPLWGMPYGLPALSSKEHQTLMDWVASGAPNFSKPDEPSEALQKTLQAWEAFFNQNSLKAQLVSRYLYEHLFLASLVFDDAPPGTYYQWVRSATPPGQPIDLIKTRRPFDAPGVARVYYRLVKKRDVALAKIHMPYRLDAARKQRWQQWFMTDDYTVTHLPSYETEKASNPFITFEQLPHDARYRFLLDEAQYTIMGFIKGPVCRGNTALNVINDHFWVFFLSPDLPWPTAEKASINHALKETELPAEASSIALPTGWLAYAKQETEYLKAKSEVLNRIANEVIPLDLNILWNGDGHNANAALTIFRHGDSATVLKGLHDREPQTAWVISYPLLERIHYLLVAGYDVYGNVGHQLNTRIYMDFLRMEGEFNFLSLLPKTARQKVHDYWYRDSNAVVLDYVYDRGNQLKQDSAIEYQTQNPLGELYDLVSDRFKSLTPEDHALSRGGLTASERLYLERLNALQGSSLQYLPQSLVVQLESEVNKQSHYYTLLTHNAYANIAHLYNEASRRRPDEDTASLLYGIVGAYPNAFLRVESDELGALVQQLEAVKSEADFSKVMDAFGVRRTDTTFWAFSDDLHDWLFKGWPIEAGWLDYNRIENR